MAKKLFWIKLNKDFFQDVKIKKIRSVAGGDTYTCIYLELLLLSLDDEGVIFFEGIEPSIEEELALKTGENVINIKAAFAIFESLGLLQRGEDDDVRLPKAAELSGGECESLDRVRKFRAKQKALKNDDLSLNEAGKALHVTQCNVTGNEAVTDAQQKSNARDRVRDREREEKELEREFTHAREACARNESARSEDKQRRFIKPSLDELEAYKQEASLNVQCQSFYDYYESKGWLVGRAPMKDWKAAMRNWARNEAQYSRVSSPPGVSLDELRQFGYEPMNEAEFQVELLEELV